MFHYRTSGLPNVWLANGYQLVDTAYGEAVQYADPDGLHDAIGRFLCERGDLSGREFRYLRVELDLSQGELGRILGKSDQAVALWEKGRGAPLWAQRVLIGFYRERHGRPVKLSEIFAPVAPDAKRKARPSRLTFEKAKRGGWRLVAAPARQRTARPKAAA